MTLTAPNLLEISVVAIGCMNRLLRILCTGLYYDAKKGASVLSNSNTHIMISTLCFCFAMVLPSHLHAQSGNVVEVDGSATTQDIEEYLTSSYTSPIDPTIDTVRFLSHSGTNQFYVYRTVETGNGNTASDGAFGPLNINHPYRKLEFNGINEASTLWRLTAAPSAGGVLGKPIDLSIQELRLNNTTLEVRGGPYPADRFENILLTTTGNGEIPEVVLNSSRLVIPTVTGFGFKSDARFRATGNYNYFEAPFFTDSKSHALEVLIEQGSTLELGNGTSFQAESFGSLNMASGSRLIVSDSLLSLTASDSDILNGVTPRTTINQSIITVDGLFGSGGSRLELTQPLFIDSQLSLGNNTTFRLFSVNSFGFSPGRATFEGNNLIQMGVGATIIGQSANIGSSTAGEFEFRNGTTSIVGNDPNNINRPKILVAGWRLDNAKISVDGVFAASNIRTLTLVNGSELNRIDGSLNNLDTLEVRDSALNADRNYGGSGTLAMSFNNAEIGVDPSGPLSGKTFQADNIFVSNSLDIHLRIQPEGMTPDPAFPGIVLYNDSIFFNRANTFGFGSVNFILDSPTAGKTVSDFTTGGENNDGVFDLFFLRDGATADSDTPGITLGANMPALLTYHQVKNPSTDNQLSVKFLATTINQNPAVQTSNQQKAGNLLTNAAKQGNTTIANALNTLTNGQVASHLNSIHAEPFSSYITVSLEHTDLLINTVLNQAGSNRYFGVTTSDPVTRQRFWIDAAYSDGSLTGEAGLGNFGYLLSGYTMGLDLTNTDEGDEGLAGLFFSYGNQKMHEHDFVDQDFKGDLYYGGLYGERKFDLWDFRYMAGYGYGSHESERVATLSALNFVETGRMSSHVGYAGLVARTLLFQNEWFRLSSPVGIDYIYYRQDDLTEQGNSALSLVVDSANSQAMNLSAGMNVNFASLFDNFELSPNAFIRYEHDIFANDQAAHEVDAALLGHSNLKQTFVGQNRGPDALFLGVGMSVDLTDAVWGNASLIYTDHTYGHEFGGSLTGEITW